MLGTQGPTYLPQAGAVSLSYTPSPIQWFHAEELNPGQLLKHNFVFHVEISVRGCQVPETILSDMVGP